jgi:hypothetical protein
MNFTGKTSRKLAIGLPLLCAHGIAVAAPFIVGETKDPRCREALGMARRAFYSTSPSLIWPIPAPSTANKIVVQQKELDISGGDGIREDPAEIDRFPTARSPSYSFTTFWAKRPSGEQRIVLVDKPQSWRGDVYSLHLADRRETRDAFIKKMLSGADDRQAVGLLGQDRWLPPMILMDERTQSFWIIDRGYPWEAMSDWAVHGVANGRLTDPCHITFGLPHSDRTNPPDLALQRLPAAVRTLAKQLDEALGPGLNEGTLQPTAGIRIAVAKGWANTALRPWSLTDQPYNNRAEVDRNLTEWAKGNRQRMTLLGQIRLTYPAAERALTAYYRGRFKNPQSLAKHALDYMFREYFVFPA